MTLALSGVGWGWWVLLKFSKIPLSDHEVHLKGLPALKPNSLLQTKHFISPVLKLLFFTVYTHDIAFLNIWHYSIYNEILLYLSLQDKKFVVSIKCCKSGDCLSKSGLDSPVKFESSTSKCPQNADYCVDFSSPYGCDCATRAEIDSNLGQKELRCDATPTGKQFMIILPISKFKQNEDLLNSDYI